LGPLPGSSAGPGSLPEPLPLAGVVTGVAAAAGFVRGVGSVSGQFGEVAVVGAGGEVPGDVAVVDASGEAVSEDPGVVVAAEQGGVCQVGGSAVGKVPQPGEILCLSLCLLRGTQSTAVLSRGPSTPKSDEAMMAAETSVNFLAVT